MQGCSRAQFSKGQVSMWNTLLSQHVHQERNHWYFDSFGFLLAIIS